MTRRPIHLREVAVALCRLLRCIYATECPDLETPRCAPPRLPTAQHDPETTFSISSNQREYDLRREPIPVTSHTPVAAAEADAGGSSRSKRSTSIDQSPPGAATAAT